MPFKAERRSGHKTKPWAIVNANTGRIVGRSTSQAKAQASARVRNKASGH